MRISRKRLLLGAGGITAIAAVGTLVLGTTLGVFSSGPQTENNTFAAGTVSLTSNAAGACAVTDIAPGDSGSCTFVATYTGSLPAYLGLDQAITGTGLWDGSASGLQFTVTDNNSTSYAVAASESNELVNTTPMNNGTATTFTVNWSVPFATGNTYQGKNATLTLTAHAVQSAHQSTTGCTAGSTCSAIVWS